MAPRSPPPERPCVRAPRLPPGRFVAPEHHAGPAGFLRLVERALETPTIATLDRELDDPWRVDL
jgi:hypothetical protein